MKVTKTVVVILRVVAVVSLAAIVVTVGLSIEYGFPSNPFLYINPPLNIAAWIWVERAYRKQLRE